MPDLQLTLNLIRTKIVPDQSGTLMTPAQRLPFMDAILVILNSSMMAMEQLHEISRQVARHSSEMDFPPRRSSLRHAPRGRVGIPAAQVYRDIQRICISAGVGSDVSVGSFVMAPGGAGSAASADSSDSGEEWYHG